MSKERSCQGCIACCIVLRIDSQPGYTTRYDNGEDIAKPAGVPCRFLTDKGCGIHEVRPQLCRKFQCDWLQGRKGFSPDKAPALTGTFYMNGDSFQIPSMESSLLNLKVGELPTQVC